MRKLFKNTLILLLPICFGILAACDEKEKVQPYHPMHWEDHYVQKPATDSLQTGKTYLSIYSHIYSYSLEKVHNLTAMVSLRNVSETDTVYIYKANYYNTSGEFIRQYFARPIYLKPLETVEIVINETDEHGGSGANFIFEWAAPPQAPQPFFEAIMTTLRDSHGLSFTTQGIRIE